VKVVISRKGCDSGSGGCDSPILDGRFISVPIPAPGIPYSDIDVEPDLTLLGLMEELQIDSLKNVWVGATNSSRLPTIQATAHLDPDLQPSARHRADGWRPMFGQVGASQSHLANHGVANGDLFLFFGRFRTASRDTGRASWITGSEAMHALWGWLEVSETIDVNLGDEPPNYANEFPHFAHRQLWTNEPNVVYMGTKDLRFAGSLPGGGVFSRYRPELRLTREGGALTEWELPAAFHPDRAGACLSYHKGSSWSPLDGDRAQLRAASRGQEFVVDASPGILDWVQTLFHQEAADRQAGEAAEAAT
jgi:hypothetical protein